MIDSSAVKAHRSASVARKGGTKSRHRPFARRAHNKNPCSVDEEGRPHAFLLTGGQVADIKGAASLLAATAPSGQLIGDKGYDADHLRLFLQGGGTAPTIPNKINRKQLFPFDAGLYRLRNVIERTFCRLKDFRAIATRYDKTARNYLAGLCLITALAYWVN
jgi:transposase